MNTRTHLSKATLLGILLPVLPIVAGGCGGKSAAPPTTTDFCSMWSGAVCQIAASCGSSLTKDACTTAAEAKCEADAASATSGGVRVFTAANIGTAVGKAMGVFAKTVPITPTDLSQVEDTFNYVFQGNVTKTMPCTTKYDCAGGEDANICDKGVCAPQVTKASGAGCSDPGAICDAASYCSKGTTGFYTCLPKGPQGVTCDASTPCIDTLRCTSAGKCDSRVEMSGTCASDDDCVSTAPYCDPFAGATPSCDKGLQFAGGSASCTGFLSVSGSTGAAGSGAAGSGAAGATASDGAAGTTGATDAAGDATAADTTGTD
jgi:hypothetical protein